MSKLQQRLTATLGELRAAGTHKVRPGMVLRDVAARGSDSENGGT